MQKLAKTYGFDDLDWTDAAAQTETFSGADIRNLMKYEPRADKHLKNTWKNIFKKKCYTLWTLMLGVVRHSHYILGKLPTLLGLES